MNELEWISLLLGRAGKLAKGAGDDAFVSGKYAISADMSVEGAHFRLGWSSPRQAAEKCLLSNFSDINAMGGKAAAILFSICINKKWNEKTKEDIANTIADACKKHKVKLLGGDTVGGSLGVFSVAVLGRIDGKALLRSAARSGDDVWVSGFPGRSGAGLALLNRGGKLNERERELADLHRVPDPPLALGPRLAKIKGVGACIDLSDSLAESLHHISAQSKVQIQIEERLLPIFPALKIDMALNGGEDYELLFTARKSARKELSRIAKKFLLSRIGEIKKGSGVFMNGRRVAANGWKHF